MCIRDRLYLVAHQDGKGFVRGGRVLQLYLQHDPGFRIHGRFPKLLGIHLAQALIPLDRRRDGHFLQHLIPFLIGIGVVMVFALGQPVEGGLGDIDMSLLDQRLHEPEEKRQQQGPDMGPVHVGIRHDDDLAVTQLRQIKFISNAASQSGDNRHQLVIAVDLIQPGLFHVEHFAPQRKDRLCLLYTSRCV